MLIILGVGSGKYCCVKQLVNRRVKIVDFENIGKFKDMFY